MNWILVCAFNLLLLNSCITANIDRGSSSGGNQQENRSGNGAQADGFNEDFLFPVFDLAELEQILQMAKKPESADFVKNTIFPAKYPNYTFYLLNQLNQDVSTGPDSLYISDFNLFVDVINHFGEHIEKLAVSGAEHLNDEESTVLFESISEHCSISLTSIIFGYITENTFTHLTKPFANLRQMYFNIRINQIGSNLPLDEFSPNLERLHLSYSDLANNIQNDGHKFIESEFPAVDNLKQLTVFINGEESSLLTTAHIQLGNMMQKNPQISKLWYGGELNDFIHEINEYLPSLEHLTIRNLNPDIRPVHFENVKHFRVTAWGQLCPAEKISFSNLKALDMSYIPSFREPWVEFFRNHQNLSQLNFEAFDDKGLVELLAELPNLHEIRFQSFQTSNIDLISRLIEDHTNLEKFYYDWSLHNEINLDMDAFREKFEHEWNIMYSFEERTFIELERKH